MASHFIGIPPQVRTARIELNLSNVRAAKQYARKLREVGFVVKEHPRPLHGSGLTLTVIGAQFEFSTLPHFRVTLHPNKPNAR